MIKVQVPATSANMGPGFDCLGVALKLYNYIYAEITDSGLQIDINDASASSLPRDERNLVYRSIKTVFELCGMHVPGLHLILENNIPVTRGLGSSSAGIVGGLTVGNILTGNHLSRSDIIETAARLEGHADNVTPAVTGGFTVNICTKRQVRYMRHPLSDNLRFAAIVPDFRLATKKARSVLPNYVPHRDAVYNAARSAMLTACMLSGDCTNMRTAMGDRLHQSYRKRLIPNMDEIFRLCYRNGAHGVYLSGAGPTIMAVIDKSNKSFNSAMSGALNRKTKKWHVSVLEPDNDGAVEIK